MEGLRIVVRGKTYVMKNGQLWCICKDKQDEYQKRLLDLSKLTKNTTKLLILTTSVWSFLDSSGIFDVIF